MVAFFICGTMNKTVQGFIMAKNKEGNEIGVIIEADDLLTQIAKQRTSAKAKALKPKKKAKKAE